ncbi:TIGR04086 family membrane protein [Clostridium grantii]|uniref:Putative membrane protein, TIGR04086 family n=1 Tax=Clostridium grantii DSM 8605 TaxID=1121316 RepID=A0A1M5SJV9_9CLOT|nr:TIGR04086 family membrane protein [Clostridium grantii]SHH38779.1 putative membrane protein, TIGR04086 family [Clostridium grantii DSM 8605]
MKKRDFVYIVEGVLRGFFLTLLLILIYSLIGAYVDIDEKVTSAYIVIVTALSVMYGSIYGGRKIESKGWLTGICVAIMYMLAIYLVSIINGRGFEISSYGLLRLSLALAVGMFSGMLSVNME